MGSPETQLLQSAINPGGSAESLVVGGVVARAVTFTIRASARGELRGGGGVDGDLDAGERAPATLPQCEKRPKPQRCKECHMQCRVQRRQCEPTARDGPPGIVAEVATSLTACGVSIEVLMTDVREPPWPA